MKRKEFISGTMSTLALASLGSILQAQPAKVEPFVVKAGKGRFGESFLYKGKNPNDIKISGKDTNGSVAMFEYIGFEKTGPSLHVHFEQDEVFYIVEGKYRFLVNEKLIELKEGDTIFLPRNIPHTWIQLSDKGKLIYFVQPAGKAEDFFRTMNNLKHKASKEEVDKIHEECGMKVIGPGLSI